MADIFDKSIFDCQVFDCSEGIGPVYNGRWYRPKLDKVVQTQIPISFRLSDKINVVKEFNFKLSTIIKTEILLKARLSKRIKSNTYMNLRTTSNIQEEHELFIPEPRRLRYMRNLLFIELMEN